MDFITRPASGGLGDEGSTLFAALVLADRLEAIAAAEGWWGAVWCAGMRPPCRHSA